MNSLTDIFILSLLAVIIYMSVWFVLSAILKRNDLADIAWGLGVFYLSTISILTNPNPSVIAYVIYLITPVWGLRLAFHIYSRNKGKTEDFRYAQWRKDWGKWFLVRSYFQVFLLQGILLLLVSTPVILATSLESSINVSAWFFAGIIIWLFGYYFESVSDKQLTNFVKAKQAKSGNKDTIMKTGLWKYSRHPNYFGEVTQWWGVWVILLSSSLPASYIFLGLIGPITITTLILFVSGVPLLEKKFAKNKQYQEYAKRTNKFFPWNPRS